MLGVNTRFERLKVNFPPTLNDMNVFSRPFFRYSTSISPPSPHPVKLQDIEIENECEFLIDESGGAFSTSWISIPSKSKRSKNDGSTTPISKSQPSEKEKPQNKKVKNRKVQVKALTKQKLDHLDVGAFDLKEMSESDPISNSEENVLTSKSRKSTHMSKLFNSSSEFPSRSHYWIIFWWFIRKL